MVIDIIEISQNQLKSIKINQNQFFLQVSHHPSVSACHAFSKKSIKINHNQSKSIKINHNQSKSIKIN
jgi:hypothetical protein